ncbi:hypothetical protein H1235_11385 [Pseudoxanthomonas sp. NC8]|nr:hypothetical protein H1235_11385 [Pseudoxanthomonas sp. NC8]
MINTSETSSSNVGFNIGGDLFELPAGAVGWAAVAEWNRQTMDLWSATRAPTSCARSTTRPSTT